MNELAVRTLFSALLASSIASAALAQVADGGDTVGQGASYAVVDVWPAFLPVGGLENAFVTPVFVQLMTGFSAGVVFAISVVPGATTPVDFVRVIPCVEAQ